MSTETLRSSVTPDGQRVFLIFDGERNVYRLATRWVWLTAFQTLSDAAEVFEALELCEGDLARAARILKAEAIRTPRHQFRPVKPGAMSRTWALIGDLERRLSGLRPVVCGSKGAVVVWRPA